MDGELQWMLRVLRDRAWHASNIGIDKSDDTLKIARELRDIHYETYRDLLRMIEQLQGMTFKIEVDATLPPNTIEFRDPKTGRVMLTVTNVVIP